MHVGFGHDEDPDDERMGAMLDPQVLDEGDETAPDGALACTSLAEAGVRSQVVQVSIGASI
jgi:hypothetical protein